MAQSDVEKRTDEVDMGQADSSLRSEPKQSNDKMDHFTALGKASKKMGHDHYMDVPDDKLEALKAMVKRFRAGEEVDEANIQPTSAKSRSHIGSLSNPTTNSVVHPSSGKEIGLITKQPNGEYYAHPSSTALAHSQGATFASKDEAHQFIRNAHAKAVKNGTLSKNWLKSQPLPQFAKGQGVAEGVALPDISGLGYNAQSLIMKLRRDVEEKRIHPTPQAVIAAARELAGDMEFAPQLLVKQVLGQGVAEGEFAGDYATGEAGQWRNKGPKANKPATIGDLVGEGTGNLSLALDTLKGSWNGWNQVKSTDPDIEVYDYDDGEGGYEATGTIQHNLNTDEITIDYSGGYGEEPVEGTFHSIGDAMNALRGGYPGRHGGKAPKHDTLASKTLAGPDDLYKTDRAGKKGTLSKARMDGMKASSAYTMRGGPKGVLPEGQEDLDTIKRLLRR